ncbi:MAG TPA: tetratricopeptide repeat protein, partial [Myxococcaceae bacterium]|nr:tetratricopeptide repeat protein [Myxococcaceae bacterium]
MASLVWPQNRAQFLACALLLSRLAMASETPPSSSEEDLRRASEKWRLAATSKNWPEAARAERQLLIAKQALAIRDLDALSAAFARAASVRLDDEGPERGKELAQAAVQLAPDSPQAHALLAKMFFLSDPLAPANYLSEAVEAIGAGWRDPLFWRAKVANFGAAIICALLATVAVVLAILCFRRARYFLHDFHHLFPASLAKWETTSLAALVVLLPIVFRLSVAPFCLTLLACLVLYVSRSERIVAAVWVSTLSAIPVLAGMLARETVFAGTSAENVYRLERGSPEAIAAAIEVRHRVAEGKAEFEELFALGSFEVRRGHWDQGVKDFEEALLKRNNDPRALTNLGNAMFAAGDFEGAADAYQRASAADPALAGPASNLAKLYSFRAQASPGAPGNPSGSAEQEAGDAERRSRNSAAQAVRQADVYRELITLGLSPVDLRGAGSLGEADLGVQTQVQRVLLGEMAPPWCWIYPVAAALALVGLGFARQTLQCCSACAKCGRAVCQRCDPELGVDSMYCHQCISVFHRQGTVAGVDRIRKQIEIARFQLRSERTSYFMGLFFSGAGHLNTGAPIAGSIYGFLFLSCLFGMLFHRG